MAQYVSEVGASKVILGLPLFGYDEPTQGPALGQRPTGPAAPVTYAQAVASGPTYWDAATNTAWTSYQSGGQWHQVFFDNANSISGKVQLASKSGLLGVGVWALGMEGSDNSLLGVLSGASASIHTPPAGPTTSGATAQHRQEDQGQVARRRRGGAVDVTDDIGPWERKRRNPEEALDDHVQFFHHQLDRIDNADNGRYRPAGRHVDDLHHG